MAKKEFEVEEYNAVPDFCTLTCYLKKRLKEFGLVLREEAHFDSSTSVILPRWAFWTVGGLGMFQNIFDSLFKKRCRGFGGLALRHPFVIAYLDEYSRSKSVQVVMKSSAIEYYSALDTIVQDFLNYLERYEKTFLHLMKEGHKGVFESNKNWYKELSIRVLKPKTLEDIPL